MTKHKSLGQVYTPNWIVNEILDLVGYQGPDILLRRILEPACGDGAFLQEIVQRFVQEARKASWSSEAIRAGLESNIFAIELDPAAYAQCLINLDNWLEISLGQVLHVNWQVANDNTLSVFKKYPDYFDFIVGNPPYIRIHNLDASTREILKKEFVFSEGTLDIYLAFFEMALHMTTLAGRIGFITPNSYLHNSSYKIFRSYLATHKLVTHIVDFKSTKLFKNYSTYTAITVLDKKARPEQFAYSELVDGRISIVNEISYSNLSNKDWTFSAVNDLAFVHTLQQKANAFIKDYFDVQYGFATLRDKIFIAPVSQFESNLAHFNGHWIEQGILKKIVKGSTFKGDLNDTQFILFPYLMAAGKFQPMPENFLSAHFPRAYNYLREHRIELEQRDIDKGIPWYALGRSQGIQSIHQEKIVCSTLVGPSFHFYRIPADVMVYSGIFMTRKTNSTPWKLIEQALSSENFYRYIRLRGKNFSGDYRSISSGVIKEFPIQNILEPKTLF